MVGNCNKVYTGDIDSSCLSTKNGLKYFSYQTCLKIYVKPRFGQGGGSYQNHALATIQKQYYATSRFSHFELFPFDRWNPNRHHNQETPCHIVPQQNHYRNNNGVRRRSI